MNSEQYNYFLNNLRDGVDIDTLAKQLTQELNDANAQFQKEQEADKRNNRRIVFAQGIIDAFDAYMNNVHKVEWFDDEALSVGAETVADAIDEVVAMVDKLNAIGDNLESCVGKCYNKVKDVKNNIKTTASVKANDDTTSKISGTSEVLDEFLRSLGLK